MPTDPPIKLSDISTLLDTTRPTDRLAGFTTPEGGGAVVNAQWTLQTLANFFANNGTPGAGGGAAFSPILANAYGNHPAFDTQDALNIWLLSNLARLVAPTTPSTAPTVTGFLPAKGAEGTAVTIQGTRFTGITSVSFNGTTAGFQVINTTTIQAVVPVGATTGPIAVSNGTSTGTSTAPFTVGAATAPANQAPTVNLTGSSSTVTTGQSVTLTADPHDTDGTIAKVEFYDNGVKIGETTSYPHAILTGALSQGQHNFTAKTTDDKGATGTSSIFTVAVSAAQTTYNGSYTARCGTDKAGTGPDVTRTAQSTTSQTAADNAARDAAIAALTCTVAVNYNTTLTAGNPISNGGMSFSTPGGAKLRFDDLSNTSGSTISVVLQAAGVTSYLDYYSEFAGKPFAFDDDNGVTHAGTFPSSDTTLAY